MNCHENNAICQAVRPAHAKLGHRQDIIYSLSWAPLNEQYICVAECSCLCMFTSPTFVANICGLSLQNAKNHIQVIKLSPNSALLCLSFASHGHLMNPRKLVHGSAGMAAGVKHSSSPWTQAARLVFQAK